MLPNRAADSKHAVKSKLEIYPTTRRTRLRSHCSPNTARPHDASVNAPGSGIFPASGDGNGITTAMLPSSIVEPSSSFGPKGLEKTKPEVVAFTPGAKSQLADVFEGSASGLGKK
jgi:hypothetical protein